MGAQSGPPPPPPPVPGPLPGPTPPPESPQSERRQADPRFDDGFFSKPTESAPRQWSAEPVARPSARSSSLGPIVALAAGAISLVLGYLGWNYFFGKEDIVYRGANGEIDAIDPQSVFVALPGFEYSQIPSQVTDQARTALSQIPGLGGTSIDVAARGVSQSGQFVAGIVTLAIDPATMEQALEEEDPVTSLEEATGTEVEVITLSDKPAIQTQIGAASMLLAFYENQAIIVAARDAQTAESIGTALLAGLP